MQEDSTSAIIASIAALLAVIVPAIVQYARLKGVQIKSAQEEFVLRAIAESARYAEEYARKRPATGAEKLDLATRYAQTLIDGAGIKKVSLPLGDRIEAALVEMPGRPSKMVSFPPTPQPAPKAKK